MPKYNRFLNLFRSTLKKNPLAVALSITLGGTIGYYHQKTSSTSFLVNRLTTLANKSPEKTVHTIQNSIMHHPDIMAAIIVRLASSTPQMLNMFGRIYQDNITQEAKEGKARSSIIATVYPWATSGAVIAPIYSDQKGNLNIAMVVNSRKQPKKERTSLSLAQGFTNHGIPGKAETFTRRIDVDECEEAILKGEEGYKKDHHPNNVILNGAPYQTDRSRLDAAKRELYEELGISFDAENMSVYFIGSNDKMFNSVGINALDAFYTFALKKPVPLDPKDANEIAAAYWIPINAIRQMPNGEYIADFDGQQFDIPEREFSILAESTRAYSAHSEEEITVPLIITTHDGCSRFGGIGLDKPYPQLKT